MNFSTLQVTGDSKSKQSASVLLPQKYSHKVARVLWWKRNYISVKTGSTDILGGEASKGMPGTTKNNIKFKSRRLLLCGQIS